MTVFLGATSLLFGCGGPHEGDTLEEGRPLRAMTWNIKGAQLATVERLAHVITGLDPDVVALQEVFFDADWNGQVNQAEQLAQLTGMNLRPLVTVDQSATEGPFGAEVGGMAILTRGVADPLEPIPSGSADRVFAARTTYLGLDLIIAHLPVDQGQRDEGLRDLSMIETAHNAILLGDLNTTEPSLLGDAFEDRCSPCGDTFPATSPTRRIDYILFMGAIQCNACGVVRVTASDHLPVVADVGAPE